MSTIDFKQLIDSVEEITQSLNAERCIDEDLQHRIRKILRELDSGSVEKMLSDRDAPMKQAAIEKIHQTAVKLWNATVAKHSGKLIPTKTNCQLRQLCFNMVCATDVVDKNFVDAKNDNQRIITMGLKVGKAWLDSAEHDNALSALKKTEAKIRGLLQSAREKDCVVRTPCEKMDLEKDLFTVLYTEAEVMISCERLKDAENSVEEASKAPFLAATPPGRHNSTEITKLCSLTFNCGLSLSNAMKYADAVRWLQKSYEVGQCGKDIKKSTLGKILRLTAHCFAELRNAQDDRNAMDTLQTAERYGSHTAGYLLKLKILARNSDVPNEEIDPVVKEFLALGETTIDLGLACCRYFNDNGRLVLCERVMDTLAEKHSNSPQVPRVYSKRFEYNMERLEPAEAIQYTREFLRGTDIIRRLDQQSRMCIQLILWKRAEVCEEKGNKDALLTWCDLSLKFYRLCGQATGNTPDVTMNIAKLLRNRTSCLLSLGRIEEASESATEASKLQPDNPRSDFALFTVALHQGNENEAISRIDRVAKASERSENSDTPIHGLVCQCAQIAFEKERFPVALKALDAVQKTTSNRSAKVLALKSWKMFRKIP